MLHIPVINPNKEKTIVHKGNFEWDRLSRYLPAINPRIIGTTIVNAISVINNSIIGIAVLTAYLLIPVLQIFP